MVIFIENIFQKIKTLHMLLQTNITIQNRKLMAWLPLKNPVYCENKTINSKDHNHTLLHVISPPKRDSL